MNADYRQFIQTEFQRRTAINPAYSLRAFARDLGVPAPQLSAVLLGKKGLSRSKAQRIAKELGLSESETERFIEAVAARHGRSKVERELANQKLKKIFSKGDVITIEEAHFKVIADWYHFAILQMTETKDFQWQIDMIAEALGLSKEQVQSAIEALLKTKLLMAHKKGYHKSDEIIKTEDVPSRAIRLNHQQLIAKASRALEEQSISERDFSSVTLAIDTKRLPEIKKWLANFRETFCSKLGTGNNRDEVYALNIHFFRLTNHKINKRRK